MKLFGFAMAVVSLMFTSSAQGGERPQSSSLFMESHAPKESIHLTGNPRIDLFARQDFGSRFYVGDQEEEISVPGHKSPWLAAGMSLVLPGAGEVYATNYWRAAAFFAIEVAAWAVAYTYDKKGDRQTDFFQNYADAHWSVVQYGTEAQGLAPGTYNWLKPGTEGLPPWQRVNWDELNRMERAVMTAHPLWGSHTLPLYGEQQYYELIGKYLQFNKGWEDADLSNSYLDDVHTARDRYYEGERARADDFYQVASTMVSIALVNHVLSAVDAALCATSFNKVHASVGHKKIPDGPKYSLLPMLKLSYDL